MLQTMHGLHFVFPLLRFTFVSSCSLFCCFSLCRCFYLKNSLIATKTTENVFFPVVKKKSLLEFPKNYINKCKT